ncbi:MAG: CDP-alcohol phosphatidyltransferase family protein [Lachnospiraceae bacterium]|nr:CDP-alcohol phosphatidyltransferase family protein [Lachnospiraceae bacterium]
MIGYYNYSVILTYIGLGFSVFGITLACEGNFTAAVFCLLVSGGCDMFDGKIARAMKSRTADEKKFGIQIDSLCDLICFGVFPALLAYSMGMRSIPAKCIMVLYILAAVIRLGFFNVSEEKRQEQTEENRKEYQGLPVTTIALIFPVLYLMRSIMNERFASMLMAAMLVIAILFITNFKVKKPGKATTWVIVAAAVVLVGCLIGKRM